MNAAKLLSVLAVASTLAACTSGTDSTGTSEHAVTSDVDQLFKRPNGNFDVTCHDGTTELDVPVTRLLANQVCGGAPGTDGDHPNPPPACMATTAPSERPWSPPARKNAGEIPCSSGDLDAFDARIDAAKTMADVASGLSQSCSACIFSGANATSSQLYVFNDDVGAVDVKHLNKAACYAIAPGGSDACGDAYSKLDRCMTVSCNSCDAAGASACRDAAKAATCKTYDEATSAACGAARGALDTACGTRADVVRAACGG